MRHESLLNIFHRNVSDAVTSLTFLLVLRIFKKVAVKQPLN